MKKREQILLQILICTALFACIWIFFLDPTLAKREELKMKHEIAMKQKENMDALINADDLEKQKEAEIEKAEQNYQFFYSVLNSYTIDEILNTLAVSHGLSIQSLQIGEYEDASDDFMSPDATTGANSQTVDSGQTEAAKLLKCEASIAVTGNYDNILAFVDAMNAKSSCLKTNSLTIRQNYQDAGGNANSADIRVAVYGVNTIEEK